MSTTRFSRLAVVTEEGADEEGAEEEVEVEVVTVAAAMLVFCKSMGMRVSTSSTCAASSIINLGNKQGSRTSMIDEGIME